MSEQNRHIVLGATGGAGRAVVQALLDRDLPVRAVSRSGGDFPDAVEVVAADGVDYENEGGYLLRLKWGRLVELEASLDTQHLEHTLDRMDADPIEEVSAAPTEGSAAAPAAVA